MIVNSSSSHSAPAFAGLSRSEAAAQVRLTRALKARQLTVAFLLWLTVALPYVRRVRGLQKINPRERCLFLCNHVSLLDSILLGAIFCRAGHLPMLVLGDKSVWSDSWLRRLVSGPFGYLLERGKFNPRRIRELQAFAQAAKEFQLVVFPEGTRGNGLDVAPCQPGVYYIAQAARVPIVPVFFASMQLVSTKTGRFHPIAGLRKVEIHFGDGIAPENYLPMPREEFTEFVRRSISALKPIAPQP